MSEATASAGYLKEDFRFFHLRDTDRRTYDFHHHDFLKILILIEGKVNYVIEGRSYHLAPWDIVLIDRGQIHRPEVDASQPYERLILYLCPSFLEQHGQGEDSLSLCFRTAVYRHSQVLRMKENERRPLITALTGLEQSVYSRKEAFGAALLSRLLCLEFLIELNRACLAPGARYITTSTLDYRVSGLLSYISGHLTEDMDIALLSGVCSLSPYHMMRIFKEETGYTIGSYITEKRLILARELLSQGIGATESCYRCGFKNYSAFLRAYKNHYHTLPKDFIIFS